LTVRADEWPDCSGQRLEALENPGKLGHQRCPN
jgi:hypothetical protein